MNSPKIFSTAAKGFSNYTGYGSIFVKNGRIFGFDAGPLLESVRFFAVSSAFTASNYRVNNRLPLLQSPKLSGNTSSLIGREFSSFRNNTGRGRNNFWLYSGLGATGCALMAFGFYYGFENYRLGSSLMPAVHAAKLIEKAEQEGNSPKYQLNFIADVVERVAPAVVFIDAVGKLPFFGEQAVTSGSGFIVRSDGYVLTNAHVVEGVRGRKLRVHLHNGTIYEGTVTYMDTTGDLALVRINAKDLPALSLGDSKKARPGEWVIAVGSPFSLTNSVTMGIISSVQRRGSDLGLDNTVTYIQTDALITFGNSGGPLVNLDGEAIGINSMKVTDGISFAIPSDYAKNFLVQCADLEENAKDRSSSWLFGKKKDHHTELVRPGRGRRRIGIVMMQLDENTAMAIRGYDPTFPDLTHGVLVHSVVIGQPAHESGIRPGDIVTHVNGKEVNTSKDLLDAVESSDTLKLRIVRKSKIYDIDVEPVVDDS